MKEEIWKPIDWVEGFENLYEVSNLGRFRKAKSKRILKPQLCGGSKKYYQLQLHKKGTTKTMLLHNAVYIAFNGHIPEGLEVNHLETDTSNNNIENFNLLSHIDNCRYSQAKKVQQLDKKTMEVIKTWDCIREVQYELGICAINIISCCKGRRKTAGGFKWRYI